MTGDYFVKITAGALIPSFATIVFNLLNFILENYSKRPLPGIDPADYDIAAGCVFSIIGICVTAKEHAISSRLAVTCVFLILFVLFGDILPTLLQVSKFLMVVIVDGVALAALCWSIAEAG